MLQNSIQTFKNSNVRNTYTVCFQKLYMKFQDAFIMPQQFIHSIWTYSMEHGTDAPDVRMMIPKQLDLNVQNLMMMLKN